MRVAVEELCRISDDLHAMATNKRAQADFTRMMGEARGCYRTLSVLSWSDALRSQAQRLLDILEELARFRGDAGEWVEGDNPDDPDDWLLIQWAPDSRRHREIGEALSVSVATILGGMSAVMESVE